MEATYRYSLTRELWPSEAKICWVMLNPSTADEYVDDPTIRRVIDFSRRWGYGRLEVVNLFAVRSTNPKSLELFGDPIGPENEAAWLSAFCSSQQVVFAWGAHRFCAIPRQVSRIHNLCRRQMHAPVCLGRTQSGAPRHPLYVKGDTLMESF